MRSDDIPGPRRGLEISFAMPPGAAAALRSLPDLQRPTTLAWPERAETLTGFDTPDLDLARQGATLELQPGGERWTQVLTLPGPAQAPFGWQEWRWPLPEGGSRGRPKRRPKARPDAARLAEAPLVSPADGWRLCPAFTMERRRADWTLRPVDAVVTLRLEEGEIRAGEVVQPLRRAVLRLERGSAVALFRIAATLHAAAPLALDGESLAGQVWRLRTGQPREPAKVEEPALAAEEPAAEALRRIIGATIAALLADAPAARAGAVEGVHRMRIAIRRLRAALVLFRPHLEPHAAARFTQALRQLGHVLGAARDWDVFCTETLPAAEAGGVDAAWLGLLRGPAEAARAAAHARLAAEFAGPAFTATLLGLAAWAEDPAALTGTPEGGAMRRPLGRLAPDLEARLARKALRRGRHIRQRPDEELHALRKSLKKLRYGLEFMAPLHRRKRLKACLRGVKALQERLGGINDASVAVALAGQLGDARQPELAPAMAALAGWADARRQAARKGLRRGWRDFRTAPLPD